MLFVFYTTIKTECFFFTTGDDRRSTKLKNGINRLFRAKDLGFEKPFSDPKPSSVWLTYLLLIPLLIQLKNICLGSSNRRRVKGRSRFPSTGLGLLPIRVSTDHGNRISYRGRFYVHAKPSSVPRSVVDISEYANSRCHFLRREMFDLFFRVFLSKRNSRK